MDFYTIYLIGKSGSIEVVEWFLQQYPFVTTERDYNFYLASGAAESGNVNLLRIVEKQFPLPVHWSYPKERCICITNNHSFTFETRRLPVCALIWHLGTHSGSLEMLMHLESKGFGRFNQRALAVALEAGCFSSITYLLERVPDAKLKNRSKLRTAVARGGTPLMLDIALEICKSSNLGVTDFGAPFDEALLWGNTGMAALLLDRMGAKIKLFGWLQHKATEGALQEGRISTLCISWATRYNHVGLRKFWRFFTRIR